MRIRTFLEFVCLAGALLFLACSCQFSPSSANIKLPKNYDSINRPESELERFWRAAYTNHKTSLEKFPDVFPADWLSDCVGQIDENSKKSSVDPEIVLLKRQLGESVEKKELASQFIRIQRFAEYIWASRVEWERVRVTGKRSFGDETLLSIQIVDNSGESSPGPTFAFAMKRVGEDYRVIDVIQTGVFEFVDREIKYASDRPKCLE